MKCRKYTRSFIKQQNCGRSQFPFLETFTRSDVTTDGKAVCFTMGSTKIIASTPYLRPIPRFGTCVVILYLTYIHDE